MGLVTDVRPPLVLSPAALLRQADHLRNGSTPIPVLAPDGWPVMGVDAWHGLAADIVTTTAPYTEADPVAVLISTLIAFGNAVGSVPGATADFSHHPARLFACLVGRSSKARKGTSWRATHTVMKLATPDWTTHRVFSGLSSGEGLIAAVKDADIGESGDEIPGSGESDKRLMAIEEEFARVLQVARREASTLSAIIRAAYDTGDLQVLTKQRVTATGAHISVLGHITFEELRAKLTDTDVANGFGNRFLFMLVRRPQLLPGGKPIAQSELNHLGSRIAEALGKARYIGQMQRSIAAEAQWADLYQQMALDDPPGIVGALTARPEAHTLRLSVAYALLDGSPVIDEQHLAAAWAVWNYARASAEAIFIDPGSAKANKLYKAIVDAGVVGLDFTAQSAVFGRNLSSKELDTLRSEIWERIVTVQVGSKQVTFARDHAPLVGGP